MIGMAAVVFSRDKMESGLSSAGTASVPSIQVEGLTKLYGSQQAVAGVTFSVRPGEVLGFLGPNGAGKTTTMRMLMGYLPPSEGVARVCGYDIEEESAEVRRRTGYLPEGNPLYPDMFVAEYLEHAASFYPSPTGKDRRKRVAEVIDQTGLGPERKKRIGQLSKGYRQRVGLAQALVHSPEVLILDEPTTGLDPNQLVDIRALIKEIGRERTVVLSTHIMQEVQAMCTRAVIISAGRIVADAPIGELSGQGTAGLLVEFDAAIDEKRLVQSFDGLKVSKQANSVAVYVLTPSATKSSSGDIRPKLFEWAVGEGRQILSMQAQAESLEQVFQRLTQQK